MESSSLIRPLAALALLAASAPGVAQSTVIETIPLPTEMMSSSILFASLAGPPAGYVVRVAMHVEFHPSGGFTADAVEVRLNAPTAPNFAEWVVQGGSTFGWPASNSVQVGDAETLLLDGDISSFFPWSIWDLSIGPVAGSGFNGVSGQFLNSYLEIEYLPAGEGPAVGYCFGAGCPCANDDADGGCRNSTGAGALLAASGTGSLASDDLALQVTGLPPARLGVIHTGPNAISLPFGDGLRCVGAANEGVQRFPVQQADGAGSFAIPAVFSAAQAGFPGVLSPGETWYFQAWYQDPGGPCGSGFNLSQALALVVIP